jgi:hypothetical protein
MTKQTEISKEFVALLDSCIEGRDGDWDTTTDEGRKGFVAMYEALQKIATHFRVDIRDAREMH